jgi:DNA-binding Lrp family transcriptional regulator
VDPVDFAIYRFLSPQGEARFWAGRRLIDPTIPAREIAERVGLSENGVRARLRGLLQRGILQGAAVVPNPSLFGVQVFVAELPIASAGEVPGVLRDLALVEGVIFARDTLDEGNREVRVHFVSESDSTTARRATLIRRLSPSGQLRAPQPYSIPQCERELSPLDWRLLRALYRAPDATIAETARTVGISLKTTARRAHELVASRACWWTHGPKSEELPLALIRVDVRDPKHRESVAGTILQEAAAWMPVAGDGLGLDPESAATVVAGLVPADAPTVLERMVEKLIEIPGVVAVHRTFALGSRTYPEWFTDRLAERVPATS